MIATVRSSTAACSAGRSLKGTWLKPATAAQIGWSASNCPTQHRRQTTTMTAVIGDDDPRSAATMLLTPLARQFDRRLTASLPVLSNIRLIAAGAETQAFGEIEHAAVMQGGTGIDQGLRLRRDGIDQRLWTVARRSAPPPWEKFRYARPSAVPITTEPLAADKISVRGRSTPGIRHSLEEVVASGGE